MQQLARWVSLFSAVMALAMVFPLHAQDDPEPSVDGEPTAVIDLSDVTPTVPVAVTATATTPVMPGSRQSPIPLGTAGDTGIGWVITLSEINPSATSAILANNRLNGPPKPGFQFFMAHIDALFNGANRGDGLDLQSHIHAVGNSQISYGLGLEDSCGVIPNRVSTRDVFTGGTLSGNICWQVRSEDANSLVMYYDRGFRGEPLFFALQ